MREKPATDNYVVHTKSELTGEEDCDMRQDNNFRTLAMVDVAAPNAAAKYNKKLASLKADAQRPCNMKFLTKGISDEYVQLMRGLQLLEPVAADELVALAQRLPQPEMWVRSAVNGHTPLEAAVAAAGSSEFGSETADRVIEVLVSRGAPLLHHDSDGVSCLGGPSSGPLHMLMARGAFEQVQRMLQVALAAQRFQGNLFTDGGEPDCAILLLGHDQGDHDDLCAGNPPLAAAIHAGHTMKLLQSPLLREFLLKIKPERVAWVRAALSRQHLRAGALGAIAIDADDFVAMFQSMVNDEAQGSPSKTVAGGALHRACEGGAGKAVPIKHGLKLVESLDASIFSFFDGAGRTVLHAAIQAGNVAMTAAILDRVPDLCLVPTKRRALERDEAKFTKMHARAVGRSQKYGSLGSLDKCKSPTFAGVEGVYPIELALQCRKATDAQAGVKLAVLVLDAIGRSGAGRIPWSSPATGRDRLADCVCEAVQRHLDGTLVRRLLDLWAAAAREDETHAAKTLAVPRRALRAAIIHKNKDFIRDFCTSALNCFLDEQKTYLVPMPHTQQAMLQASQSPSRGGAVNAVRNAAGFANSSGEEDTITCVDVNVRRGVITPLELALQRGDFDMARFLLEQGARVNTEFLFDEYTKGALTVPAVFSSRCALPTPAEDDAEVRGAGVPEPQLRAATAAHTLYRFLLARITRDEYDQEDDEGYGRGRNRGGRGHAEAATMLSTILDQCALPAEDTPLRLRVILYELFLRSAFVQSAEGRALLPKLATVLRLVDDASTGAGLLGDRTRSVDGALNEGGDDTRPYSMRFGSARSLIAYLLNTNGFTEWHLFPRCVLEEYVVRRPGAGGFNPAMDDDENGEDADAARKQKLLDAHFGGAAAAPDGFAVGNSALLHFLYHKADPASIADCQSVMINGGTTITSIYRSNSMVAFRQRLLWLWDRCDPDASDAEDSTARDVAKGTTRAGILQVFLDHTARAVATSDPASSDPNCCISTEQLPIMELLRHCKASGGNSAACPVAMLDPGVLDDAATAEFIAVFADSIVRTQSAPWRRASRVTDASGGLAWRLLARNIYGPATYAAVKDTLLPKIVAKIEASGSEDVDAQRKQLWRTLGFVCISHRCAFCPVTGAQYSYDAALDDLLQNHAADAFAARPDVRRRLALLRPQTFLATYFAPCFKQGSDDPHTLLSYLLSTSEPQPWNAPVSRDFDESVDTSLDNAAGASATFGLSDFLDVIAHAPADCASGSSEQQNAGRWLLDEFLPRSFMHFVNSNAGDASVLLRASFWRRLLALCIAVSNSGAARGNNAAPRCPGIFALLLSPQVMHSPLFLSDEERSGSFQVLLFYTVILAVLANNLAAPQIVEALAECKRSIIQDKGASMESLPGESTKWHEALWARLFDGADDADKAWDAAPDGMPSSASRGEGEGEDDEDYGCGGDSNDPPPMNLRPSTSLNTVTGPGWLESNAVFKFRRNITGGNDRGGGNDIDQQMERLRRCALWTFIAKNTSFSREFTGIGGGAASTSNVDSVINTLCTHLKQQQPNGTVDALALLGNWQNFAFCHRTEIVNMIARGTVTLQNVEGALGFSPVAKLLTTTLDNDNNDVVSLTCNTVANQLLTFCFDFATYGPRQDVHLSVAVLDYALAASGNDDARTIFSACSGELVNVLRAAVAQGNRQAMRIIKQHTDVLAAEPVKLFSGWGKVRVHESVYLYEAGPWGIAEGSSFDGGVGFTHRFACSAEAGGVYLEEAKERVAAAAAAAAASSAGEEEDPFREEVPDVNSDGIPAVRSDLAAQIHAARLVELAVAHRDNFEQAGLPSPSEALAAATGAQQDQLLAPTQVQSLLESRIESGGSTIGPALCSQKSLQHRGVALQIGTTWQMRVFERATEEDVVAAGFDVEQLSNLRDLRVRFEPAPPNAGGVKPGCFGELDFDGGAYVLRIYDLSTGTDGANGSFVAMTPQVQRLYESILAPKLFSKN